MECINLYREQYQGKLIKMGRTKEKREQSHNMPDAGSNDTTQKYHEDAGYVVPKSTVRIVYAVLGIGIGALGWMVITLFELKSTTTKNSTNIETLMNDSSLEDNIKDLQGDVDELNVLLKGNSENDGILTRIALIENILDHGAISASDDTIAAVSGVTVEANDISNTTAALCSTTCLGTDSDGNIYIAEELIGETILLTYTEGNQEIYFLGQYNENYRWDGYCVTNSYSEDGALNAICESNFDDGKRLDYLSLYSLGENEWRYSDRICTDDGNVGVSICYSFNYDKDKNFTKTNARITDILYADEFLPSVEAKMLNYSNAVTSEGYANDHTGNAYEVIFDDDGTVKTLYVGDFENGKFNDDDAWEIAYSYDYNGYFYNIGEFKNNHAVNQSILSIDIDEINAILEEHDFKCDIELSWKQE
jgi:hypothetical protein